MNPFLNTMLQPAVMYGSMTVCLSLSVLVLIVTRMHFRALGRHLVERQTRAEGAAGELRDAFGKLRAEVASLERHAAETAAPPSSRGMNLSRRSHALRMHRRGDSADQIASDLSLPRQEVELLLKVHRIVMTSV